jgi:hypothetical protein
MCFLVIPAKAGTQLPFLHAKARSRKEGAKLPFAADPSRLIFPSSRLRVKNDGGRFAAPGGAL